MRRSLHPRRCRGVDLSRTPAISIPAPSPLPHACSSDLGSRDSPLARPPLVCLVPDFSDRVVKALDLSIIVRDDLDLVRRPPTPTSLAAIGSQSMPV